MSAERPIPPGFEAPPEDWARMTPDAVAVVDGDRTMSFGEWSTRADRLADALVRHTPTATRAAVRGHQSLDWFVIRLALAKLRWEHIAVSWRLTPYEVAGILGDCRPAWCFVDDREPARLAEVCAAEDVRMVSMTGASAGATTLDALLAEGVPVPRHSDPRAPFVSYSSGTTGKPRGARKRRARDADDRKRISEFVAPTTPASRRTRSRRALLTLPLHHGAGVKAARTCHLSGGTVYLLDRYDPVRALELIQRHRITEWKLVPTMLHRLRALPPEVLESYDVSSLRAVSVGSASTPWPLKEWVLDHFGPVLYEGYGATEVGMVAVMPPGGHRRRPGSCGRLRPHVEVRVVDAEDRELPRGEVGELLVRTPIAIESYLNDEGASTGTVTTDGFVRVGDLGWLDESDYLYIAGRAKDMIIAGGVNIYPAEVENAMMEHPDVVEVAVVGVPEATFGEQVVAYCEVRPGSALTGADLVGFLEPRLAPYKRPRHIRFVTEFPRNPMGKVIKAVLRDDYLTENAI